MPYVENRVRFEDYGSKVLERNDPRLVPVQSYGPQQYLHWAAAERLQELLKAAEAAGFTLRVASGWRPPRFATVEDWHAFLRQRYGSVEAGRKWLGFRGGHNLGLSMDLVGHGLEIKSATAAHQKTLPVHAWLRDNAWRYGLTPYKTEPWHWEANVGLATFRRGSASYQLGGMLGRGLGVLTTVGLLGGLGWLVYKRARPRVVVVEEVRR